MTQRHEIRIRFGDAALIIDGKEMDISEDVALLITNAITTYLSEWFAPDVGNNTFTAPMSSMKIKVEKTKDEVVFEIEE